jgi:beta-glucosidase
MSTSPTVREGSDVSQRGSSPTVREGSNITVTVEVKNTGSREGDEVVQLYTHQLVTSVTTYEKNLRGFERLHLKPGEPKPLVSL